ncbi:hypothetical protein HAX54_008678 [Datura stramonium]|uniref:Uncharacterized protein n=1 Tax=Datura stramonium TaxID=4076 RepID=A0ABS8WZX3_DATST|nr:hypothetical protein [Datura stramonium]
METGTSVDRPKPGTRTCALAIQVAPRGRQKAGPLSAPQMLMNLVASQHQRANFRVVFAMVGGRIKPFRNLNLSKFCGSGAEDDPQYIMDRNFKAFRDMDVDYLEVEFVAYQLKGETHSWF